MRSNTSEEAIARVLETARDLRSNHFVWIVNAAIAHFKERVQETELAIIRHHHFTAHPLNDVVEHRTRERVLNDARATVEEYRRIQKFLIALHDLLMLQSAEEVAARFADFLRTDHTRKQKISKRGAR